MQLTGVASLGWATSGQMALASVSGRWGTAGQTATWQWHWLCATVTNNVVVLVADFVVCGRSGLPSRAQLAGWWVANLRRVCSQELVMQSTIPLADMCGWGAVLDVGTDNPDLRKDRFYLVSHVHLMKHYLLQHEITWLCTTAHVHLAQAFKLLCFSAGRQEGSHPWRRGDGGCRVSCRLAIPSCG